MQCQIEVLWSYGVTTEALRLPGELLDEEFLKRLGLTKYRLAMDIGVPPQRIGDIVAGKRAITADDEPASVDGGQTLNAHAAAVAGA
jgi:hypothetical protein